MASGYTTNYGLCQWQPQDSFLREEFNGDNRRVDTVLGQLEHLAEGAGHNVYNLILQNYYEGKETGWKKALVFDGFRDQTFIDSLSEGLVLGENRLVLSRDGQENVELGCTATNNSLANRPSTKTCTAAGCGVITGFRFYTALVGVPAGNYTVAWSIYINGTLARQSSLALYCPLDKTEQSITIPRVTLTAGDRFYLQLHSTTGGLFSYTGADGGQCGTILIEPISAPSGQVTTPALDLPERSLLRAWVRHSGGSVGLTALSGGEEFPLEAIGTRQTVNSAGVACTEAEYRLEEGLPQTGTLAFRLDLDPGGDNAMWVFDYGVMLA